MSQPAEDDSPIMRDEQREERFQHLLTCHPAWKSVDGPYINGVYAVTFEGEDLVDAELEQFVRACAEHA